MKSDDDTGPSPPRRQFLGIAIVGTAGAFAVAAAYPAIAFVNPKNLEDEGPSSAGRIDDFAPGSARTVLFGERPALIVRTPDGELRAFVALCTHMQCIVRYAEERGQIVCPCHQGVFDLSGHNVSGPPPRPLEVLRASIVDGNILLSET
jgi:cytochrome b6-f complex iron-sulfur subunit